MKPTRSAPVVVGRRAAGGSGSGQRALRRGRPDLVVRRRVGQQEPDAGERPGGEPVVDGRRLLDRVDARHERRDVDGTLGQQIEEAGEIAALGPAHVAGRVVDALELVAVVVASRPVGAREPDLELLVVVRVPGQVELGLADVDDPGAIAGQPRGDLDGAVRVAARGKQHVVGAQPAGPLVEHALDLGDPGVVRHGAGEGPGLLGRAAPCLDGVEAHDLDAGRDEEPHGELADESEADHAGGLAEGGLGAADALHGDRSDGGERGVLGRDTGGHRDAEVDRHPVDLGVQGELVARGGDDLTDGELLRPGADLDDDPAQRVPERRVAVEPVHRLLVGRDGALLRDGVEQLAHLVRPSARLADQRHPCLADLHHLGAGRDEGEQRAHEDAAGLARRRGDVEHGELPGAVVLRDLLHQTFPFRCRRRRRCGRCGTRAPSRAAATAAWTRPAGRLAGRRPSGAARPGATRRRR